MISKKKFVASILAISIVAALAVGGTLAYLTDQKSVENTFTVGKLAIKLDEAPVNDAGVAQSGTRVTANKYKLVPGHSYDKDPTIHVQANSEASYLFVKVEDGLAAVEDATTIADQISGKGWQPLTVDGNVVANVYFKEAAAVGDTPSSNDDYVVFETFKLKTDADVSNLASAKITVTAYAVQQDGFSDAADAWKATFGAS